MDLNITQDMIDNFLAQQTTKGRRRVIWNSYAFGTYIRAKHGPIGTPKHAPQVIERMKLRNTTDNSKSIVHI